MIFKLKFSAYFIKKSKIIELECLLKTLLKHTHPGDPISPLLLPPIKTSAWIYYFDKGRLITRNAALKVQNKFEMQFIKFDKFLEKSVTESLIRNDD